MLLTSRETHRWVISKGWPIRGKRPAQVAAQEAYEEAGLVGQIIGKRPVGRFQYEKQRTKKAALCEVRAFSFRVECQLDDWPEKSEWGTKWFDAVEAASLVNEGGLAEIIDRFAGSTSSPVKNSKIPGSQRDLGRGQVTVLPETHH